MNPLPESLWIRPFTKAVRGEVVVPGSKSLTNRALALAALCRRPVTLSHALFSEDSEIMVEALRQLGLLVTADYAARMLYVSGQESAFRAPRSELFVGLAGTAARFLTALCAAAPSGIYVIDGTSRMRERPMSGLIDALRALSVDIRCTEREGHLPVEIRASGIGGGVVRIDARDSSQYLSALLMAAPLARAPIEMELVGGVRMPFVQMTARMMGLFGQPPVQQLGAERFRVDAPHRYDLESGEYAIEPDASAASYLLALPLVAGGEMHLPGMVPASKSLQGDIHFTEVLTAVGATLGVSPGGLSCRWDRGFPRRGVRQDFSDYSDTFLTLAAISPLLDGPTRITGIAHTRKQETDRIGGVVTELRKLGQEVTEMPDGIRIEPRPLTSGVEIETYGDHRFAMSFALLGCHDLHGDGRPWLMIRNPAVCAKTFPEFFDLLGRLHASSH